MKRHKKRQLSFIIVFVMVFFVLHLMYSPFWGKLLNPFDYREEILYYANRYDLDPYLVAAVIYVESKFNPEAVSPKGARGLMQLMPDTAGWAASQIGIDDYDDDMLFEPNYNIHFGTWYLATLLRQFDDNMAVALAAYNGGRTRVERWLKEGVWDGNIENTESIPISETQSYVEKVVRAHERYESFYKKNNKL